MEQKSNLKPKILFAPGFNCVWACLEDRILQLAKSLMKQTIREYQEEEKHLRKVLVQQFPGRQSH